MPVAAQSCVMSQNIKTPFRSQPKVCIGHPYLKYLQAYIYIKHLSNMFIMPIFLWMNTTSLGCCRTLTFNTDKPKPFSLQSPEGVNLPYSLQMRGGILEFVLSSLEVGVMPLTV